MNSIVLKSLNPIGRIRELTKELRRTQRERAQARNEAERFRKESERLEKEKQRLEDELARLRKELDAAQRAAKRQAAPFLRNQPKSDPQRPGRKPGTAYGQHHRRPIPDRVDEEMQVAAPEQCPECGAPLRLERVEWQYQEEVVRRTFVRRFRIPICRCERCHKRVQGRHPLQTSDALGAAAVQIGPEAVTLGVLRNKSQGLPHADAAVPFTMEAGLEGTTVRLTAARLLPSMTLAVDGVESRAGMRVPVARAAVQ